MLSFHHAAEILLRSMFYGLLLYSTSAIAQFRDAHVVPKDVNFEQLQIGSGIEVNLIYDILQDRQGFIWFGTFNGVVRHDGYNFIHFEADLEDSTALQDKKIVKLMEDPSGNIWALGSYVNIYDPKLHRFQILRTPGNDSLVQVFVPRFFEVMLADSSGNVWIPDHNGLLRIQKDEKGNGFSFRRYLHDREDNPSANNSVNTVFLDSKLRLWLGTGEGLSYYDKEHDRVIRVSGCCATAIYQIEETSAGRLLLATEKEGLYLFDPQSGQSTSFRPDEKDPSSIAGPAVAQLAKDGRGNIWLLAGDYETLVFTLQRFDPERQNFQHYFPAFNPTRSPVLGGTNVQLYTDREGFLWVITGTGLLKFNPLEELFTSYRSVAEFGNWHQLYDIYQDRTGVLWLGSFGQGVYKYAPSSYKFDVISLSPELSVLGSAPLRSLFEDSQGQLWLGNANGTERYTLDQSGRLRKAAGYAFSSFNHQENEKGILFISGNEGLKCFDLNSNGFTACPVLPMDPKLRHSLALIDRDGGLWFNTWGQGLFYLNSATGESVNFKNDPEDPASISINHIHPGILQDKSGMIWISSPAGLNRYDPQTDSFALFLDEYFPLHLYLDRNEVIWVSTNGQGLVRFDTKTGASKRYYPKNGFPARLPMSIFQDERGNMWIASDVGLIWFDPETEQLHLFDESDGIPAGYFANLSLSCQRANGEILFGLRNGGFLRFHPDSVTLDQNTPHPAIVDFKLFNREVPIAVENSPLSQSIWTTKELTLAHDQNVFSLEYAALHYAAASDNRYAYLLEGADKEWNYVGHQRIVNFAGLIPGNYVFRVKAANHDGIWNEETTNLMITILPPWWRTWWAYTLYVLAAIGAIAWYVQRLRQKVKMKQQQLEKEQSFNIQLATANQKLKDINLANSRFVPIDFLRILKKESILDLKLGDHTQAKMTVLFADIRSYTTLSETMTPEENFKFINSFLGRMGPLIQQKGGFICQYFGDGIMALFKEKPENAIEAAVEMQRAIQRYNQKRLKQNRRPVQMGLGLNTGTLMLGVIGDKQRYDSSVISDAVNTASRMEGLTKIFGGSIIISEKTRVEIPIHDQYLYRYLGKIKVKGKEQALKIYDCYEGDAEQFRQLKIQTQADFEQGIQQYFDQQFGKAADLFKEVLKKNPDDLAANYYFKKALRYLTEGVERDWTGVEEMVHK